MSNGNCGGGDVEGDQSARCWSAVGEEVWFSPIQVPVNFIHSVRQRSSGCRSQGSHHAVAYYFPAFFFAHQAFLALAIAARPAADILNFFFPGFGPVLDFNFAQRSLWALAIAARPAALIFPLPGFGPGFAFDPPRLTRIKSILWISV